MANPAAILGRGVCGNFRFKFYTLTNVLTTHNIIPGNSAILYSCSTNTSDKTDVFGTRPLNITGTTTADGGSGNLTDNSGDIVFNANSCALNGLSVVNTTDGTFAPLISIKNTDELYVYDSLGVATDVFDSAEAYQIQNDRFVDLTAGTATDDGRLIIIGR